MAETAPLTNQELSAIFHDIADRLEIKGENAFKIRAYRKGAEAIAGLDYEARRAWQEGRLQEIPGIGEAISSKIDELFRTGRLGFLERLAAEVPEEVAELVRLPAVGPKLARTLIEALGSVGIAEVEVAGREGRLKGISGIGPKTEARIMAGIAEFRQRQANPPRRLLGALWPRASGLLAALRDAAGPVIQQAEIAGSLRRRQALVGGIDLVIASEQPGQVVDLLRGLPQVAALLEVNEEGVRLELHSGDPVFVRVVPPARWGAALHYMTGSRAHNERMRSLAQQRKRELDAAGMLVGDFRDEAALYAALGLAWIPPELREAAGEFEAARDDELPELIELGDLRGDLHMHSTWSDGQGTIAEMAAAARARGYDYIVITDHSQSLTIAGGLDVERLSQQRIEILNVNARYSDFLVLQGAEVEIRPDGELDYPDEVLQMLDVVVASLHSGLRQDRDTVTRRALNALRNPHVDILGHPTGRLLNRRAGADLDMDEVIRVAAETGTILEINSQVDRLDLDPTHVRAALEMGCLFSVDSDAHHPDGLEIIQYGIWQARRGWLSADDVINTLPLADFLDYIHRDEEDEDEE